MKFGLFMMPIHPPEKDRTECFEEDIALIIHADELGMSEAWFGQHHTVAWEPIPSNDVFIATLIPRTKQIRLGAGVSIMPQHHPVNVAVRAAFLDHLSRGRINWGFGQGGVSSDWGLFDLPDPKTQGLMTVEAIDVGGFGTFLMVAHDWDDKAKWIKSMETLANEIVPALPTL